MAAIVNPAIAHVQSSEIRNVLLTGHVGCGKTLLIERILYANKTIARMGGSGSGGSGGNEPTICDYEAEEKIHKHSLKSALVHLVHARRLINLIDSPGSPDFVGHAIAAMPAVETVLVVVDAAQGIEVTTRRIMKLAGELSLPRMVVINKIDHEGVDLSGLLVQIREAFGAECLAINLPIRNNTDVIDVLDHGNAGGGPEPEIANVAEAHRAILEQIVEMDEELTGEYFEKGDHLDPMKVHRALEAALNAGHLVPVLFCSARTGAGIEDLLHILADSAPGPLEANPHVLSIHENGENKAFTPEMDPAKPAVAHVFKIINDPFLGKLAIFKVVQGTVRTKSELLHGESRKPVRIAHLYKMQGKDHIEVDHITAGDIGCVPKIDELKMGSILHMDPVHHAVAAPRIPIPKPLYGLAVELKNHADEVKFAGAVAKLAEEDPCFVMERVAATGQTVLRGLGELHLRVVLEKLKSRYNIDMVTKPMKVAYKETITAKAEGHHRHKKQTGGAGQFGEVYLRVEPLPPDHPDGFEFINDTVGGSIPRQFMPAIEKGCRTVLATGAFAGYPLTGVRVSVYDGKYHDVDSKEVAFVAAGKKAFIDAVAKARPALLEPLVAVEVTAPQRYLGDITADLSGRRGRIESSETTGEVCVVRAVVPLAELMNYSTELKSMTGGQGSYAMEYSHDERTPPAVQATVVAAFKPKEDEE